MPDATDPLAPATDPAPKPEAPAVPDAVVEPEAVEADPVPDAGLHGNADY